MQYACIVLSSVTCQALQFFHIISQTARFSSKTKVCWFSLKVFWVLRKLEFSRQIFEKYSTLPLEGELFYADGQT
jgi:hypothetical protein